MIFKTEILLKVALKTLTLTIVLYISIYLDPFITCNIPKSSNILVLHVIQGSTLTVVRLPGASENGTQLVRSEEQND